MKQSTRVIRTVVFWPREDKDGYIYSFNISYNYTLHSINCLYFTFLHSSNDALTTLSN
uniref:Uncharacterized protein n=1 Tax=Ciona intestinalis TaxID=7719 RepID=H2XTU0_CIOIN